MRSTPICQPPSRWNTGASARASPDLGLERRAARRESADHLERALLQLDLVARGSARSAARSVADDDLVGAGRERAALDDLRRDAHADVVHVQAAHLVRRALLPDARQVDGRDHLEARERPPARGERHVRVRAQDGRHLERGQPARDLAVRAVAQHEHDWRRSRWTKAWRRNPSASAKAASSTGNGERDADRRGERGDGTLHHVADVVGERNGHGVPLVHAPERVHDAQARSLPGRRNEAAHHAGPIAIRMAVRDRGPRDRHGGE